MQRFQFGRRLALFCQTRMREQRANVMGYSAEQIASSASIGFTSELPPQRDKRREPSLSANRETECHPSDRQSIVSGARSQAPRPVIFDQNRVILFKSCTITGWESSNGTGSFSVVIERIWQNRRSASRNDQIEIAGWGNVLMRRSSRRSMIASLLAACSKASVT